LRLKFFVIIFSVLALTAASVSAIHFRFFKLERIRLIELNLQQNASLIANTDLSYSRKEFSHLGEEFITDVIGDDKINVIVAIYNNEGKVLYKNENAYIFELSDRINPSFPVWENVEKKDYFIKYLTQKDPKHGRIIKVGMILNQSLLRWKDLNQRIFIFVGIILTVIMVISFFLTFLLFRPVQALAELVNQMSERIERGEIYELQSWFQKLKSKTRREDEFSFLLNALEKLAKKIGDSQQMTQRWSALMAHELKTPMTLLRMSIDELMTKTNAPQDKLTDVEQDLKRLENIVMDFLEWASVENDAARPEIYALNMAKKTEEIVNNFGKTVQGVEIEIINKMNPDERVFCNPIHYDQLLNNILSNSSKYGNGKITIICETGKLTIIDNGNGIPDKVLNNFGKPFNKYDQKNAVGHGLGLAWINTIVKKYNWKILIDNLSGTRIEILFPST
jgi:signal transduction histidine kinase